jgi:hypothetical protein
MRKKLKKNKSSRWKTRGMKQPRVEKKSRKISA